MHLVFDICQGIGIAAAVGIRPFVPALAVGALAAGDVQIDFKGTDYAFVERAPFLLAMVVCAFLLALAERPRGSGPRNRTTVVAVVGVVALALGALLFAAALAQAHSGTWPGYVAGVLCAAVGIAATVPLLFRVRARLDPSAASAVPLYAESAALVLAVLSVLAPPVGVVGLVLLVWLLLAGRRREGQKYAGLRILR